MNKKSIGLMIVVAIIAIFSVTKTANAYTIGQTGPEIVDLQFTLIEAGYDIPLISSGIAKPGYFGPQTQKALAAYNANQSSELKFGAVSTLDGVDNPFVSVGGLQQYWWSQPLAATSSVICSIQNPYTASTTIASPITVFVVNNRFGSVVLDISTSSTRFGSSTPALIKAFTTPSVGSYPLVWDSAASTTSAFLIGSEASGIIGNSNVILRQGEFLNVRVSTSSPGTFAGGYNTGRCGAILQRI